MDKKLKDKYLRNPRLCPYCESNSIIASENYYGEGDFGDPKHIYIFITCDNCNKEWTDHFRLISVSTIDEEIQE